MRMFVIYFRYQQPEEKKPGPVRHFKIEAENADEARATLRRHANYKGLEIIRLEEL